MRLILDTQGTNTRGLEVNGRKASIKRRIDKGIANISWPLAFPKATISHLGAINSDHAPILLDTNPNDNFSYRPFRFEAVWLRDE